MRLNEIREMIPRTLVLSDFPEDADIEDLGFYFLEIWAVRADERCGFHYAGHPHVVKDDVTANLTKHGTQSEIG